MRLHLYVIRQSGTKKDFLMGPFQCSDSLPLECLEIPDGLKIKGSLDEISPLPEVYRIRGRGEKRFSFLIFLTIEESLIFLLENLICKS